MPTMQAPKILLLQARNHDDRARNEERHSFAEKAGLEVDSFVPYDLLAGPPSLAEVLALDAVMVGGSGEYYVSKRNLPDFERLMGVLRQVTARGHPIFASCFGFQLLVEALGGEIVYDPEAMEVGTFELTLTEAGRVDELLGALPATFRAQLGRKDRAARLPASCVHLASSERCPFQALRVPGKPIWATQFHPELNVEENLTRYRRYLEGYAAVMSEEEQRETLARFVASPETEGLIRRFLDLVFT